jgi:hypothetical protein
MTDPDLTAWEEALARADHAEAEKRRLADLLADADELAEERAALDRAIAAARAELTEARAAAPYPRGWVIVAVVLAMFVVAMAWVILVAPC